MDRCKTCKHWQAGEHPASNSQREGLCRSVVGGHSSNGSLAKLISLAGGGYNDSKLVTHEQFGCVQHESKPKGGIKLEGNGGY